MEHLSVDYLCVHGSPTYMRCLVCEKDHRDAEIAELDRQSRLDLSIAIRGLTEFLRDQRAAGA